MERTIKPYYRIINGKKKLIKGHKRHCNNQESKKPVSKAKKK